MEISARSSTPAASPSTLPSEINESREKLTTSCFLITGLPEKSGKSTDTYYDYRTNIHHTLKRSPLRLENRREFIDCYKAGNRHKRKPTWDAEKNPDGRWRKYTYEELAARDKTSLDLFWLKDDTLTDLDNLPEPEILTDEIIDNIEAGLASFRTVAATLSRAETT